MRLHLVVASVLALSGCTLYFGEPDPAPDPDPVPEPQPPPVPVYKLTTAKTLAGYHPIVGIDTDQAGGLWIAYREEVGGYYDNDNVWIVHLDYGGVNVSEWLYQDDFVVVGGLAFTGDAVWLNYNYTGVDHAYIRKLDPNTGVELARFATDGNVVDLEAGDEPDTLLLSKSLNAFTTIRTTDGGEVHKAYLDAVTWTTQLGLAAIDGKRWVASRFSPDLVVLDDNGALVARATTSALEKQNNRVYLAKDTDGNLLLSNGSQIFWLTIN